MTTNNQVKNRITTHPGVFLKEEYMDENNISLEAMAIDLNMDKDVLNEFVSGNLDCTGFLAKKLQEVTNVSVSFWLNLQEKHNESE